MAQAIVEARPATSREAAAERIVIPPIRTERGKFPNGKEMIRRIYGNGSGHFEIYQELHPEKGTPQVVISVDREKPEIYHVKSTTKLDAIVTGDTHAVLDVDPLTSVGAAIATHDNSHIIVSHADVAFGLQKGRVDVLKEAGIVLANNGEVNASLADIGLGFVYAGGKLSVLTADYIYAKGDKEPADVSIMSGGIVRDQLAMGGKTRLALQMDYRRVMPVDPHTVTGSYVVTGEDNQVIPRLFTENDPQPHLSDRTNTERNINNDSFEFATSLLNQDSDHVIWEFYTNGNSPVLTDSEVVFSELPEDFTFPRDLRHLNETWPRMDRGSHRKSDGSRADGSKSPATVMQEVLAAAAAKVNEGREEREAEILGEGARIEGYLATFKAPRQREERRRGFARLRRRNVEQEAIADTRVYALETTSSRDTISEVRSRLRQALSNEVTVDEKRVRDILKIGEVIAQVATAKDSTLEPGEVDIPTAHVLKLLYDGGYSALVEQVVNELKYDVSYVDEIVADEQKSSRVLQMIAEIDWWFTVTAVRRSAPGNKQDTRQERREPTAQRVDAETVFIRPSVPANA